MKKYGNWKTAFLRTVFVFFIIESFVIIMKKITALLVYHWPLSAIFDYIFDDFIEGLYIGVAALLFANIASLVFVGLPAHYVICRWFKPRYLFYAIAAVVFSVPLMFILIPPNLLEDTETIFLYYFFFISQVILFRHYAFREIVPGKDTNSKNNTVHH